MSKQARYISSKGQVVELDGPTTWIGTAEELLSNNWTYSVGYKNITGVTRSAVEKSVDAFFKDASEADKLRRIADFDVMNKTPGIIEAKGMIQRAYIVSSEPYDITRNHHIETLTVILLDGIWGKWKSATFFPIENDPTREYLDLPVDCEFDVIPPVNVSTITNESLIPAPFKITVWGPATNPFFRIGDNRYELLTTIPSGSRIEIDSQSFPRTITLITEYGDKSDMFSVGTRGSGQGCGEYIFEPIPSGVSTVYLPGGFGIDVDWLEQDGVPPWKS